MKRAPELDMCAIEIDTHEAEGKDSEWVTLISSKETFRVISVCAEPPVGSLAEAMDIEYQLYVGAGEHALQRNRLGYSKHAAVCHVYEKPLIVVHKVNYAIFASANKPVKPTIRVVIAGDVCDRIKVFSGNRTSTKAYQGYR